MASIKHLNPSGLPRNPAFAQGVSVEGPARTVYVGGQNGIEPDGTIAGDDLDAQTRRALLNVELALADAGARLEDVVTWSIALVEGRPLAAGFQAFQQVWGTRGGTGCRGHRRDDRRCARGVLRNPLRAGGRTGPPPRRGALHLALRPEAGGDALATGLDFATLAGDGGLRAVTRFLEASE